LLGGLFLGRQANRQLLKDPKLRSQYIDDVKKTKDETLALFNDLDVKPPETACSNTIRKRGAISERQLRSLLRNRSIISSIADAISDAIGDVAKLVSCALNVVNNLVDSVEADVIDVELIENLTDTLAEIGKDLEDENENTKSSTKDSSTTGSASSSSSSCTASTAIPRCTETVSFSTSFISGVASSYTVATITETSCSTTTIAGCTGTGSTVTTSASTSGPSCNGYTVPSDNIPDDSDEDDEDSDSDTDATSAKRSVAGRVMLERRAGSRTVNRFGDCSIPDGYSSNNKISYPGNPTVKQIVAIDQKNANLAETQRPKASDLPLMNGIKRYYNRDASCDGNTNYKQLEWSIDLKATDYSIDHACKLFTSRTKGNG
jgi:hypothetical protein